MRKITVKKSGTFLGEPEYEASYRLAGKSAITANGKTPSQAKQRLRAILGIGK